MASNPSPLRFLNSTAARILTAALLVQSVVLYGVSRTEILPNAPPLSTFPTVLGSWKLLQEGYVDEETRNVLQADDLLSRTYSKPGSPVPLNLFIAAFRSQRTGKAPHSPKNCLPGAGWVQSAAGVIDIDIPGRGRIQANRYIVSKGDHSSVVIYWYQSRDRIVASEYEAKVYVVADSMRYNRTDTALVRFVAPVVGNDAETAEKDAVEFIQASFPHIKVALPQ